MTAARVARLCRSRCPSGTCLFDTLGFATILFVETPARHRRFRMSNHHSGVRTRVRWGLIIGLAGLLAAGARLLWPAAHADWLVLHPPGAGHLEVSRDSVGVAGLRDVEIAGPRGTVLRGWVHPSSSGAFAILLHGTTSDRSSLTAEMRILAAGGIGFLAIDWPGHGLSTGQPEWGRLEREALTATVDWVMRTQGIDSSRVGAAGFSMGGYPLVQVAADDRRIRRIALVAAPSDLRQQTYMQPGHFVRAKAWLMLAVERMLGYETDALRPVDAIRRLAPRPVLIIAGDHDQVVPVSMAQTLYAAAGEPKRLVVVPNGQHLNYASVSPQLYADALREFFAADELTSRQRPGAVTAATSRRADDPTTHVSGAH
jgi:uncharacterized protein